MLPETGTGVSDPPLVHKGHSLTLGRDLRQFVELDKNNLDIEEFDTAKRQIPGKKSGIAKETFRNLRSSLTEEQVKIEAGRCLGCGASVVDEINASAADSVPQMRV